jgi:hypothetical protein
LQRDLPNISRSAPTRGCTRREAKWWGRSCQRKPTIFARFRIFAHGVEPGRARFRLPPLHPLPGCAFCGHSRRAPVAPKQEPSCSISIFIGVNVAVHAVTAFWAAAKTSRADVVPAMCSVPSTPRSIHPAFTASNISSAGPVWPFGIPNCSNAFAHPAPHLDFNSVRIIAEVRKKSRGSLDRNGAKTLKELNSPRLPFA